MPAAAVIPAPVAYIKVVAVKKLVVRTRVRGRVRGPGAAAPSSVVDFGRPCAFPALSAGVNRLYIRHAVLPAKLRGGVVGVFSDGFAAEVRGVPRASPSSAAPGFRSVWRARSKGGAIRAASLPCRRRPAAFARRLRRRRRLKGRLRRVVPSRVQRHGGAFFPAAARGGLLFPHRPPICPRLPCYTYLRVYLRVCSARVRGRRFLLQGCS